MKKLVSLFILAIVICCFGCNKETIENEGNVQQQSQLPKQLGKFKKELIVTDESGKNQAFYAIYADDSELLENYIKNNEMYLVIEELPSVQSQNVKSCNVDEKPQIWVDLITTKLEDNVKTFSLAYKPSLLKSASSYYITSYSNGSGFIGVVYLGWGNGFWARTKYYTSWWDMQFGSSSEYWHNFIGGTSYWGYIDLHEYKQYLQLWPEDNNINWKIAYSISDFRGQSCTIGSYDSVNCYVGTPPSGTTAFIWGEYFYYTPLPGNVCPVGLGFDGVNCGYLKVPANCSPFIYSNNFYVEPDLILP